MADKRTTRTETTSGPTSGVMASGAVGKAARNAARDTLYQDDRGLPAWDEPKAKFADDDNSIDARMWRLKQDHIAMGSR